MSQATAPKIHEWTGPTGVKFREVAEPSGTYYREGTPRAVIDALERARKDGSRIRLFLGDKDTGAGWNDENDVTGRVGRTMGHITSPILLANARSMGGGIILTDCIVRLLVDGKEVYRHPLYKDPVITLEPYDGPPILVKGNDVCIPALTVGKIDGKEHAKFTSRAKAERWKAFMEGKRMGK